jgi:hypothetical protein
MEGCFVNLKAVVTEDVLVWMVAKNFRTGKYEPITVAWYSIEGKEFLTKRTFSSREEAQDWLDEFWQAVWHLT